MKNVKIQNARNVLTITMTLAIAIILLHSFVAFPNEQTSTPKRIEDVVDIYISNMKQQNIEGIQNMIMSTEVGYDARVYNFKAMNEFANIQPDNIDKLNSTLLGEIITSQYKFIKEKFGENAWENVTYDIVKKPCASKKEEFVNTDTCQIISEKEALEITENYWKKIAKEKGIEYEEFLKSKEYCGKVNKEDSINIMMAIELGYMPPVKVNFVDEYDYYEVYLSFNGKNETNDGENSFKISIDNKDNILKVRDGLQWVVPISQNNGECEILP